VIDDLGQAGEAAVMHERAVEQTGGIDEVPQRGGAGVGQVRATTVGGDDAVVQTVRINIKLRWSVAT
jgi:hypothetical protein